MATIENMIFIKIYDVNRVFAILQKLKEIITIFGML